jgi:hypothetical protein
MKTFTLPRIALACVLTLAASLGQPLAPAATFHVNPAGDDAGDGGRARPWRTLERARHGVREALAQASGDNIEVVFDGGTYVFEHPVCFRHEDSGKNGRTVTYRAREGETVVFTSAAPLSGWKQDEPGRWQTRTPPGWHFRQLYINGRKARRSRTPNGDALLHLPAKPGSDGFVIAADLLPSGLTPAGDAPELNVYLEWMHKRLRISEIVPVPGKPSQATAKIHNPEWNALQTGPQGAKSYSTTTEYWLENSLSFLDAPGEWFHDTATRTLYYLARADENLADAVVTVPRLESLVVLDGTLDRPVQGLRFVGLTFADTNWTRPDREGLVDIQGNMLVPSVLVKDPRFRHQLRKETIPAAFNAHSASDIHIVGCRFERLGGSAINFDTGGTGNRILGNRFADIAGNGITMGDDAVKPGDPRWWPSDLRIARNLMERVGTEYHGAIAILVTYAADVVVEHNTIRHVPYTGISVGWGWAMTEAVPQMRNVVIRRNRIESYCEKVIDGGGVYTPNPVYFDAEHGRNRIHENYIDAGARGRDSSLIILGIYFDGCSSGWDAYDNVIANASKWWVGNKSWGEQLKTDINVVRNYTTHGNPRLTGLDASARIMVADNHIAPASDWPEPACAIIARAGHDAP